MKTKECPICNVRKPESEFRSKTKIYRECKECKSLQGKKDSIKGTANEYLVLGALMYDYPNIMMSSSAQTAHDIIIHADTNKNYRIQVKTVQENNSLKLTGGGRAGSDGQYGVPGTTSKIYPYTSANCDLIIGVKNIDFGMFELYFVPALVLDAINQKSISVNKIKFSKNDYKIIDKCLNKKYAENYLRQINSYSRKNL